LLHWPGRDRDLMRQAWESLMEIYDEGLTKAIGVSNFNPQQLQDIMRDGATTPAVNQIEFHPFVYSDQAETLEFCKAEKIVVEAYSPLARGQMIDAPEITQTAEKLGKTNAQIMIRWAIQHDTVPIPRSKNPEHIRTNFEVFDFKISDSDMEVLDSLG
jgi:methylglyoxal/glyoxal reductase